jgi:membrane-associated protein
MTLLQGLHGTLAAVLLCTLLFVDEAGLPLPIAPNEALLLLTGVLIASGEFSVWIIFPAAFLAMTAGMIAGYGWARTVGQSGLVALAERLHANDAYERAQSHLQSASPVGIGITRMIPGLRPYATLISGAAEVDLRTFMLGALPALLLWEIGWVALGMLVGLPVVHLLGRFEQVFLRGGVLIALGAVVLFAVRGESPDRRGALANLAPRLRAILAVLTDAGIVACVVTGIFLIADRVINYEADGWIALLVGAVLLLLLLIAGRSIQTPGETLFDTHYWRHSTQPSAPQEEA